MPNRVSPVDETAARLETINVIDVVRGLGSSVLDQFLSDLAPHFAAIQRDESGSAEALKRYLLEAKVSALVIEQVGGVEAFEEAHRRAEQGPAKPQEEVIAQLDNLSQ